MAPGASCRFVRPSAGLLLVALIAGCGGGGKEHAKASAPDTATSPATTATSPTTTERTETATAPAGRTQTTTSPEGRQGGAGDEQPAYSQALFTGRGGRLTPAVVRVPAYIAIRIELRSGDGGSYGLRFAGRTLRASRDTGSTSASLAGLRPGKELIGEPVGGGNQVRVEATAVPGP
jgi:hypothetical protein